MSVFISANMQLFYQNVALKCIYNQYMITSGTLSKREPMQTKTSSIPFPKPKIAKCNCWARHENNTILKIYSCNHHQLKAVLTTWHVTDKLAHNGSVFTYHNS